MASTNNSVPRFPIEPLMDAMGVTGASDFAEICGIARRTYYRLKESGLTLDQADKFAVKFVGLHPFCVWGDAFYLDLWPDANDEGGSGELGEAA